MSLAPQIAVLSPDDAAEVAALHARAMRAAGDAWDAGSFAGLLADPQVTGLGFRDHGAIAGVLLLRAAADEAEILTLAVDPAMRRRGIGRRLVVAALERAAAGDAARVFLEVAVDNAAAAALYRGIGFTEVGRRPGYYARAGGRVDALVLARATDPGGRDATRSGVRSV